MNLLHFKSGTPASWKNRKGTFTYIGTNKFTGSIIIRYDATLAYDYTPETKLMRDAYLVYRHQHLMDTHTSGDAYEYFVEGSWRSSFTNNPTQFSDSVEYRRVPKDLVMCYDPTEPADVKPVYVTTADIASNRNYHVFNSWRA